MQGVYRLEFPLTPTLSHQGRGRKRPSACGGCYRFVPGEGEHGLADIFLMQFDTEMF